MAVKSRVDHDLTWLSCHRCPNDEMSAPSFLGKPQIGAMACRPVDSLCGDYPRLRRPVSRPVSAFAWRH